MKRNLTPLILVLANLPPLFGVLFFNWNLSSIMLLYWMESVIIGIFNIFKMIAAAGPKLGKSSSHAQQSNPTTKFYLIPFFMIHYGIFMAVHFIFLLLLFQVGQVSLDVITIGLMSLLLSHGLSFLINFLGNGEYKKINAGQLMGKPYSRIFIMQATIIFGGFIFLATGAPAAALLLMVALKVGADLMSHLREHEIPVTGFAQANINMR